MYKSNKKKKDSPRFFSFCVVFFFSPSLLLGIVPLASIFLIIFSLFFPLFSGSTFLPYLTSSLLTYYYYYSYYSYYLLSIILRYSFYTIPPTSIDLFLPFFLSPFLSFILSLFFLNPFRVNTFKA